MKRNWIAAVGLLLAMVFWSRASFAAGENLIPNGNFDTDLIGWDAHTIGATVEWSSDDADGAPDSGAAGIHVPVSNFYSTGATLRSACVPVVGGSDYIFAAATKRENSSPYFVIAGVTLNWAQGPTCGSSIPPAEVLWQSGDWATASRIVSAPADAGFAYINLFGGHRASSSRTHRVAAPDPTVKFDNIFFATACGGACGDVVPDPAGHAASDPTAGNVTSSDALYIVQAAIGEQACPLCICDVNDSGGISATDALLTLAASVGGPVTLTCPQ